MRLTRDHHRFYNHYLRLGPGHPGSRYINDLGIPADQAHRIADDLTGLGLIDAEMEMGSTWLGDID